MALKVVLLAVTVRVIIALATQTFFQPDEYFQSLEVAHHLVFGYGHLTWEWLTEKPIRSIFYPLLNVPIFYGLRIMNLDNTRLLIWGPKVLHGLFAALTDIFICRLATRVAGERYTTIAFWLSLTSMFNGLSLSRSLSNSLETSLTTVALSLYPWDMSFPSWRRDYRKALSAAAIACAVRPTNAIVWVYMIATTFWSSRRNLRTVFAIAIDTLCIGAVALVALCALDTWYYGSLALTPLNFLSTNLSSVSLFYGSSHWSYYLSQAIPLLCGTSLPFAVQGAVQTIRHSGPPKMARLLGLVVWTIVAYSFIGHKEWRFIHPLLPVLHILAAVSMIDYHDIFRRANDGRKRRPFTGSLIPAIRTRYLLVFLANIPPLLYLMLAHSRAQVEVMHYLRGIDPAETLSVGFLMPCHSTPWQAYLHRPSLSAGRLWALGCEPPLGVNASSYRDQTDIFYESPITYLRDRFPTEVNPRFPPSTLPSSLPGRQISAETDWQHEWPQYLVCFGALLGDAQITGLLRQRGYRRVWHLERGWEGDNRRRDGVFVLKAPELRL